jgi:hypothetical protein
LQALILHTGPVTERPRVREIDDDEGQRLVQIVRRPGSSCGRPVMPAVIVEDQWVGQAPVSFLVSFVYVQRRSARYPGQAVQVADPADLR